MPSSLPSLRGASSRRLRYCTSLLCLLSWNRTDLSNELVHLRAFLFSVVDTWFLRRLENALMIIMYIANFP